MANLLRKGSGRHPSVTPAPQLREALIGVELDASEGAAVGGRLKARSDGVQIMRSSPRRSRDPLSRAFAPAFRSVVQISE